GIAAIRRDLDLAVVFAQADRAEFASDVPHGVGPSRHKRLDPVGTCGRRQVPVVIALPAKRVTYRTAHDRDLLAGRGKYPAQFGQYRRLGQLIQHNSRIRAVVPRGRGLRICFGEGHVIRVYLPPSWRQTEHHCRHAELSATHYHGCVVPRAGRRTAAPPALYRLLVLAAIFAVGLAAGTAGGGIHTAAHAGTQTTSADTGSSPNGSPDTATPRTAAGDEKPQLDVSIDRLTPSHLESGDTVELSGTVTNNNKHEWGNLQAYMVIAKSPFTSRSQLRGAVTSNTPYTGERIVEL